ncbi:MAG: hypothetical protein HYZ28_19345, partial [Myxococcales bacterium]|nr:hypothetical protein [Myxococcales bacterium]
PVSNGTVNTNLNADLLDGQDSSTFVKSVTASAPLASSLGQNPNITITQSATAADGYLSSTDWNTFNNKVSSVAAGNTSITLGGTAKDPTVATNPTVVQNRVNVTCRPGSTITTVNQDGTVNCSPIRVIRYNVFNTYEYWYGWSMGNNDIMFGGVNPSTWSDGNGRAWNINPAAGYARSFFNKKLYPGPNALVHMETYAEYGSSTNGKHVAALMRIRNTTGGAISWTPCFYYTSYGSWNEWASLSLNGGGNWDTGGGNNWSANGVCPTLSIPASRTSSVVVVVGSFYQGSWNTYWRSVGLAFYNNSLNLPAGLEWADDLDTLSDGTNIWSQ